MASPSIWRGHFCVRYRCESLWLLEEITVDGVQEPSARLKTMSDFGGGSFCMGFGLLNGHGVVLFFVEVFAQKCKGALAIDGVWAVEVFNFGFVGMTEQGIVAICFGIFVCDPFVGGHTVVVTAFDHEGAWTDEPTHFGIVECVAEVELEDFIFFGKDIAVFVAGGCVFPDPFVIICRADGEAILF